MCFQRSIDDQFFAHIQRQANMGHDPIIRESSKGVFLDWPTDWGKGSCKMRLSLGNGLLSKAVSFSLHRASLFLRAFRKP